MGSDGGFEMTTKHPCKGIEAVRNKLSGRHVVIDGSWLRYLSGPDDFIQVTFMLVTIYTIFKDMEAKSVVIFFDAGLNWFKEIAREDKSGSLRSPAAQAHFNKMREYMNKGMDEEFVNAYVKERKSTFALIRVLRRAAQTFLKDVVPADKSVDDVLHLFAAALGESDHQIRAYCTEIPANEPYIVVGPDSDGFLIHHVGEILSLRSLKRWEGYSCETREFWANIGVSEAVVGISCPWLIALCVFLANSDYLPKGIIGFSIYKAMALAKIACDECLRMDAAGERLPTTGLQWCEFLAAVAKTTDWFSGVEASILVAIFAYGCGATFGATVVHGLKSGENLSISPLLERWASPAGAHIAYPTEIEKVWAITNALAKQWVDGDIVLEVFRAERDVQGLLPEQILNEQGKPINPNPDTLFDSLGVDMLLGSKQALEAAEYVLTRKVQIQAGEVPTPFPRTAHFRSIEENEAYTAAVIVEREAVEIRAMKEDAAKGLLFSKVRVATEVDGDRRGSIHVGPRKCALLRAAMRGHNRPVATADAIATLADATDDSDANTPPSLVPGVTMQAPTAPNDILLAAQYGHPTVAFTSIRCRPSTKTGMSVNAINIIGLAPFFGEVGASAGDKVLIGHNAEGRLCLQLLKKGFTSADEILVTAKFVSFLSRDAAEQLGEDITVAQLLAAICEVLTQARHIGNLICRHGEFHPGVLTNKTFCAVGLPVIDAAGENIHGYAGLLESFQLHPDGTLVTPITRYYNPVELVKYILRHLFSAKHGVVSDFLSVRNGGYRFIITNAGCLKGADLSGTLAYCNAVAIVVGKYKIPEALLNAILPQGYRERWANGEAVQPTDEAKGRALVKEWLRIGRFNMVEGSKHPSQRTYREDDELIEEIKREARLLEQAWLSDSAAGDSG